MRRKARLFVALVLAGTSGLLGGALIAPATGAASFDPSPVKQVEVNGASFGYRTVGQGPALVMITGFGSTMAEWDPALIQRLARRHHVILFDNRGMGESADASVQGLTIRSMANDTARLIEKLTKNKRAHVLGWSMGSFIAQELTLRHPQRVRRLVLAASDPGGTRAIEPEQWVVDILNNPDATSEDYIRILFPADRERAGFAYFDRISTWPGLDENSFLVPEATAAAQYEATGPGWYGAGRGTYARLPRIGRPTLVTDGRLDLVVPPGNARIIAQRVPDAQLKLYRNSGHAFLFQFHDRYSLRVSRFTGQR